MPTSPPRKTLASTTARGYGAAHRRERAKWEKRLKGGAEITCFRGCGTVIRHGDAWDLGHTDDRTAWTGPECVKCNRSAGGRNGAAVTNSRARITRREW